MFYKKLKITALFIILLSQFCFAIDSATKIELENIFKIIPNMLGKNIVYYPAFKEMIKYDHFDYTNNMEVYKAITNSVIYYYIQNNIICGIDAYVSEKTELEVKEDIKLMKDFCLKYGYLFENEFKNEQGNISYYNKNNITVSIITYNDDKKNFRLFFAKMKD